MFDPTEMSKLTPNINAYFVCCSMGAPISLIFYLIREAHICCLDPFAAADDVIQIVTDKIYRHIHCHIYMVSEYTIVIIGKTDNCLLF